VLGYDVAVRRRWIAALGLCLLGCATGGQSEHVAPPTSSGSGSGGGGEASSAEREPQIVKSGKSFKLGFAEAAAHYRKGQSCAGADAPEVMIGTPDQKNVMQIGRDRVVTYGFRFEEGTLMVRCRADHVEATRELK
jgi:hypothetical protein